VRAAEQYTHPVLGDPAHSRGRRVAALAPVVLSLLLLAAHVVRAGGSLLLLPIAAVLGLLGVRRRWAARLVQAFLVLATFEWLMTAAQIGFERAYRGEPMLRAVLIVVAVAALTAMSALAFQTRPLRAMYGLDRP
jgi:hypothetical protein